MTRIQTILCDICQAPIDESTYSVKFEWRKRKSPVQARDFADVCPDCGFALVNKVPRFIEQIAAERRAKRIAELG